MIVVDTSALLAIALAEPEREEFIRIIRAADRAVISAVSVLEAGMVLRGRHGPEWIPGVKAVIKDLALEIVTFDANLATAALATFDVYGKGIHPRARLNMGDCAVYALAKIKGVPLLFKGGDFAATDIVSAVA